MRAHILRETQNINLNVTQIVTINLKKTGRLKNSLSNVLEKRKTVDILRSLHKKPNNVRGLYRAVGGILSTIVQRVQSLRKAGLIKEVKLHRPGRFFELTHKGKSIVMVLKWLEHSDSSTELKLDAPKKWILVLLCALGKIKGSTRLEKLLFLLKEQYTVVKEPFYDFIPYLFGPFSPKILEDAKNLQENGLIEVTLEVFESASYPSELSDAVFIRKNYELTQAGREIAEDFLKELMKKRGVKEALFKLREFNAMPLSNLLNFVYHEFPNFTPPDDLP